MSPELTPIAVFGHTAFCEVGTPSAVAVGPNGLIAVGGSLGRGQWNGFDINADPVYGDGPLRGWHRCGVFDATGRCISLVPTRWPVNCVAFNADGSVLAVGAGSYDGGYCFDGELLVNDLASGGCSSVLEQSREVLEVEWLDHQRLRILVSPAFEEDEPQEPSEFTLSAPDWSSIPARSVALTSEPVYRDEYRRPDHGSVRSALQQIAADAGLELGSRRQVWAVEATAFGALAALEGVELEAWERSGDLRYRRSAEGNGRQIVALVAGSVLTNVEQPWSGPAQAVEPSPSVVNIVDVAEGRIVRQLLADGPTVVTSAGGMTLVRATDSWRRRHDRSTVDLKPDGSGQVDVPIGGYDLVNHYFAIRRAPVLLALQGRQDRPFVDKWVVRLARRRFGRRPPITVEPLFALEWDATRNGHLQGGPGVFIDDEHGPAIVHSGHVHSGAGLLSGNAFVVRRRYPSGEPAWVFTADCQAVAVDEFDGELAVAFADGNVVRLDARTGSLLRSQELKIDGHRVVPLSLSCAPTGEIYIGTMDGRIVVVR